MKTYRIFDTEKSLLSQGCIISAKRPIDAMNEYCKVNHPDFFPKRSGGNDVRLSATEVVIQDGNIYLAGKATIWYKLKQK